MKPREEAAGKVKVAELAGAMCMEELCQLRGCILATRSVHIFITILDTKATCMEMSLLLTLWPMDSFTRR